jgi:hypothetical protein
MSFHFRLEKVSSVVGQSVTSAVSKGRVSVSRATRGEMIHFSDHLPLKKQYNDLL